MIMRHSHLLNQYAAAAIIVTACLLTVPRGIASDDPVKKSDPGQPSAPASEKPATPAEHFPFVGVGIEPLHPAFAAQIPNTFAKGQGLLVVQVGEGSPAEKAGIKVHDILMTLGDQRLFSQDQLSKLVLSDKV